MYDCQESDRNISSDRVNVPGNFQPACGAPPHVSYVDERHENFPQQENIPGHHGGSRASTPIHNLRHRRLCFGKRDFYDDSEFDDKRARIQRTQQAIRSMPRSLAFDGTGHWYTFKRKLLHFIKMYNLSESDSLSCLIYSLSGSAGQLFAALDENRDELSFQELLDKLDQTYGNLQTELMSEKEFETAMQNKDESLQQWADRVQRLGCRAFKSLPPAYEQSKVVHKFCQGLNNSRLGYELIMREPKTLPDVLRLALISESTFRSVVRKDKPYYSKVRFAAPEMENAHQMYDDSDDESDGGAAEYDIRAVNKSPRQFNRSANFPRNRERALLLEIVNVIQRGLNISNPKPNSDGSKQFNSSRSTQTGEQGLQTTTRQCFKCGDPSHFQKDCAEFHASLNQ